MTDNERYDAVIIGAGVIGSAIAFELAPRAHSARCRARVTAAMRACPFGNVRVEAAEIRRTGASDDAARAHN